MSVTMTFLNKIVASLLLCSAIAGVCQENNLEQDIQLGTYKPDTLQRKEKNFLFASLSIAPGGGYSARMRKDSHGLASDFKIGVFPVSFDSIFYVPTVSYDFINPLGKNETNCLLRLCYIDPLLSTMVLPWPPPSERFASIWLCLARALCLIFA